MHCLPMVLVNRKTSSRSPFPSPGTPNPPHIGRARRGLRRGSHRSGSAIDRDPTARTPIPDNQSRRRERVECASERRCPQRPGWLRLRPIELVSRCWRVPRRRVPPACIASSNRRPKPRWRPWTKLGGQRKNWRPRTRRRKRPFSFESYNCVIGATNETGKVPLAVRSDQLDTRTPAVCQAHFVLFGNRGSELWTKVTIGARLSRSAWDADEFSEHSSLVGLTKVSADTLILGGTNTYSGDTFVIAGTLALTGAGSMSASSNITVNVGATLDVSARTDGT